MFSKSKLSTYITPVSITRSVDEEGGREEGDESIVLAALRKAQSIGGFVRPDSMQMQPPPPPLPRLGGGGKGEGRGTEKRSNLYGIFESD